MIWQHLMQGVARFGDHVAVVHGGGRTTYAQLACLADQLAARWSGLSGQRVAVEITSPVPFLSAALALDRLGACAFLVGRRGVQETARLQGLFHWTHVLTEQDAAVTETISSLSDHKAAAEEGRVFILTSGTTGAPKAVSHTWETLARPARRDPKYAGTAWLCAYPLSFYAGTQVFLQTFLNWASLVVPESVAPQVVGRTLADAQVNYASGTPTFWRQLLFFAPRADLERCRLRQVTLGGEPVTQDLLDQLRLVFPQARIVHIYASTEMGRLFSVMDGREGFPASYLSHLPEEGMELRIVNGELQARSRNAMIGYDRLADPRASNEGWFATGDLAELNGDRVLFRGRNSDIINVGGAKVMPLQVEAVLRSVPGVAEVRVYPVKSSLAGQIVAADVVVAPGAEEATVRDCLQRTARDRLRSHEVPRLLQIVKEISVSSAFKVFRRSTADE